MKPIVGFVERDGAQFVVFTRHAIIFNGPIPIILDTGARIWVPSTRKALKIPRVVLVSDGSQGFGLDRSCIVSVPTEWCSFISADYADQLATFTEMNVETLRIRKAN